TEFWLDDDTEEIVACVRLRFWLTPSLEAEGGHIGYDVRPSSRGRGFGTAALGLVLPEARRIGLERVRITVDSDNLPSIRVIDRNGGVLTGEAISEKTGKPIKQYWIQTSRCTRGVHYQSVSSFDHGGDYGGGQPVCTESNRRAHSD